MPNDNKDDKQKQNDTTNEVNLGTYIDLATSGGAGRIPTVSTKGTNGMTVGRDIMTGATFQKYEYPHKLEGVQLQYASNSKAIKVVNFKQDYVVLIRKKLFYAANSASQIDKPEDQATLDDGNYVRSYKLDNFVSLRTNISVSGSPGNCQIEVKGAERVYCFEENSLTPKGVPLLKGMVCDEWPDNYANIVTDSQNSRGVSTDGSIATTGRGGEATSINPNYSFDVAGDDSIGNRDNASSVEMDGHKATFRTRPSKNGVTTIVRVYQDNLKDYVGRTVDDEGEKFHRELHQDEYGTYYEIEVPLGSEPKDAETQWENDQVSGWKIAEKCDWEPMDEVWIFGKSNFERDPETGDFKMNQIFFGYIDTVTKQHSSGKTSGCTISITATDQLKILDLSYVTMNPSMTPGASGIQGLDLRYSAQDGKHFGTFELFNPYMVNQLLSAEGASGATEDQKEVLRSSWRYLSLTNFFAGRPVNEIIKTLCLDAGVPTWYLKDRIEPIKFPPFTYQLKNANSSTLFNGSLMKRLQECTTAAKKLMLEFFADEEGNIVLKCPNYALGVNTLPKNNMNFDQLSGGLLHTIDLDNIQPYYSSNISEDVVKRQEQMEAQAMSNQSTDELQIMRNAKKQLTPEAKEYFYQKAMEEALQYSDHNYTQTANYFSGATEVNPLGRKTSANRTYNPYYNKESKGKVEIEIAEGDTFYNLAKKYLNDGNLYMELYNQAKQQMAIQGETTDFSPNECSKLVGRKFQFDTTQSYDAINSEGVHIAHQSSAQIYEHLGDPSDPNNWSNWYIFEEGKGNANAHKTQEEYETIARKWYNDTLSEQTDALIPEIPQEYILSFSLTDSDKNMYNMYEINIEGDFGIFDKGGAIQKISRVFPDITSMVRFGCRPNPSGAISFPYMGNRENAHLLGYMMSAQSVARRKSATLSMIEDSYIKVGNPIRFFAYDEHPDIPLSPQGNHSVMATALNRYGANGNTDSFQTVTNNLNAEIASLYGDEPKRQTVTTETSASGVKTQGTGNPTSNTQPPAQNTGSEGLKPEQPSSVEQSPEEKIESAENQQRANDEDPAGVYEDIVRESGTAMQHKAGKLTGSDYAGVKASQVAQHTDAQSIYYVEQVSRSIGTSKESTMTLTLTCGRMMGKPSAIDAMLLLYKTYFDPNLGFCSDIGRIAHIVKKYKGVTKQHTITPTDTLTSIAQAEYQLFKIPTAHTTDIEDEKAQDDPYMVDNIISGKGYTPKDETEKQIFQSAKQKGWTKYTSIIEGTMYEMNSKNKNRGKVEYSYKYYIFDYCKGRWFFVRNAYGQKIGEGEYGVAQSDELPLKTFYSAPDEEDLSYDVDDLNKCQAMYNHALKYGDDHEFYSNAKPEKIFSSPSFDIAPNKDEKTLEQRLLEEFANALVALNTQMFGNSLGLNNQQFNQILHDNVGKAVTIPQFLDIGKEYQLPQPQNVGDEAKKEVALSDADKQFLKENGVDSQNVKKTQERKGGHYITTLEGDNFVAQTDDVEGYKDNLKDSGSFTLKYKDPEGDYILKQGVRVSDATGNQYVVEIKNKIADLQSSKPLDNSTTTLGVSEFKNGKCGETFISEYEIKDTPVDLSKVSKLMSQYKDVNHSGFAMDKFLERNKGVLDISTQDMTKVIVNTDLTSNGSSSDLPKTRTSSDASAIKNSKR